LIYPDCATFQTLPLLPAANYADGKKVPGDVAEPFTVPA